MQTSWFLFSEKRRNCHNLLKDISMTPCSLGKGFFIFFSFFFGWIFVPLTPGFIGEFCTPGTGYQKVNLVHPDSRVHSCDWVNVGYIRGYGTEHHFYICVMCVEQSIICTYVCRTEHHLYMWVTCISLIQRDLACKMSQFYCFFLCGLCYMLFASFFNIVWVCWIKSWIGYFALKLLLSERVVLVIWHTT